MMTYRVGASIPAGKLAMPQPGSGCSRPGLDAAKHPAYCKSSGMGTGGGGQAAFGPIHIRKYPVIQPLSKSRDGRAVPSGFLAGGSPDLTNDERLDSENNDPEENCGRHFVFDKKCVRLERTRTVIPPLPRHYQAHRAGTLHPFGLSKEFSHRHAGRPFTLGYPDRYELNTSPAFLFPSALVVNGRNTFPVENCKLSRPKMNYPTSNLLTVKDNQKSQSYPDPMSGASRSFFHRISELSSLQGDTVRQENLKKMKKARNPPS